MGWGVSPWVTVLTLQRELNRSWVISAGDQNLCGVVWQELRPGTAQKVWVQSQTTFAVLVKDEEGHWCARVLKQKIWVEGVSYELQEIYGMQTSASIPSGVRPGSSSFPSPPHIPQTSLCTPSRRCLGVPHTSLQLVSAQVCLI